VDLGRGFAFFRPAPPPHRSAPGKVAADTARAKAEDESEKFRLTQASLPQPVDQDFDQAIGEVKKIEEENKKKAGHRKKGDEQ